MSPNRDQPVVVAEVGSVHDGSFGNAMKLIELAKSVGADVVKFQTHLPQFESTTDAPSPSFFSGENRYDYFHRTGFAELEWQRLIAHASDVGIAFMSSVFSLEAFSLLREAGVNQVKVPSGEVTNVRLLEKIAEHRFPTLLSTGMSNWAEVDAAVEILRGVEELTVMQCTSAYPTTPNQAGINVVEEIRQRYPFRAGFSDHTEGVEAAVLALGKGARVFEKHLTFSRQMYGSDAPLATEPKEFSSYVASIRNSHEAISSYVDKNDLAPFAEARRVFMKGLYFSRALRAGSTIEADDLVELKPWEGVSASEVHSIVGKTLRESVASQQPVLWEHF